MVQAQLPKKPALTKPYHENTHIYIYISYIYISYIFIYIRFEITLHPCTGFPPHRHLLALRNAGLPEHRQQRGVPELRPSEVHLLGRKIGGSSSTLKWCQSHQGGDQGGYVMLVSSLEGVLPKSSHDFLVPNKFSREFPGLLGCDFFAVFKNTPGRYESTKKKLFKTKRAPSAPSQWRYWGARMVQNIPMMACIPTNDSTVFTCAGRMRCFFSNMWQQLHRIVVCLKPQEHPTCGKNRLLNDGGVLYIIFDTIWIWVSTVDSDIHGWACCLHIFINRPSWCHRHCLVIFLVALCAEALC